ncbi:MAG: helix-turn-helix domain-containing protein [Acidobacteriales bacterium]|nr:helix-turn-helix domain-containing protein [Terriglobales bacterium]
MNIVWKSSVGDPQAKLVLLRLADRADKDGICWPSLNTLAAETELHRSTVCRKLDELESAKFITRERFKNGCKYDVSGVEKVSHAATGSDKEVVAGCDRFDEESSRRLRPVAQSDQSHTATQVVAGCDSGSRTERLSKYKEPPENHQRTHNSQEGDDWSEWDDDPQTKPNFGKQAEEIVNAYPRKQKVAISLEIVRKDLRAGCDFDAMLAGTRACAAAIAQMPSGALNRYVPSAESFFRDKRWQDDPQTLIRKPDAPPLNGHNGSAHRAAKRAGEYEETNLEMPDLTPITR